MYIRASYRERLSASLYLTSPLSTFPSHILSWTPLVLSHITFTPSTNFYMNTHNVPRLTNQREMPAERCTQDISMTANASDDSNSSPNIFQGLNIYPHENASTCPETRKLKGDGELLRAPQTPTVPLPEQEDEREGSEDISYTSHGSGLESDPECVLMGKLKMMDDDPEAMLGCIDDLFPGLKLLAMS